MASDKRILYTWEILDLLMEIDEGYKVTDIERVVLDSVKSIDWSLTNLSELPKSM